MRRAGRRQESRIAAPLPRGAAIRDHEIPGRTHPQIEPGRAADVSQRYEPVVHALPARATRAASGTSTTSCAPAQMSLLARGNRFRRLCNRVAATAAARLQLEPTIA